MAGQVPSPAQVAGQGPWVQACSLQGHAAVRFRYRGTKKVQHSWERFYGVLDPASSSGICAFVFSLGSLSGLVDGCIPLFPTSLRARCGL